MKKLSIRNIIRVQYNAVQKIAEKVLQHFNETDIHDFRVSVKKIKCLLLLAGMQTKKIKIYKLPKKLRKFYLATGNIRNLQIEQQQLIPAHSDAYNSFLKSNTRDNITLLKKIAEGRNPFEKGAKKLIQRIPNTLDTPAIKRFSVYEINKLKKLMQPAYTKDAALHTIRKTVKNILYEWNFLPAERPDTKTIQQMNELAALLGRFQDTCTRLSLLNKHNSKQHLTQIQKIHLAKEKDRSSLHQVLRSMTA